MALRASGTRVLIEPIDNSDINDHGERLTEGGLVIPKTASKDNDVYGRVVDQGTYAGRLGAVDGDSEWVWNYVGQLVMFKPYAGSFVREAEDRPRYQVVDEKDLLLQMDGTDASKFTALNDYVVIKHDRVEEKTAGGIILTDRNRDSQQDQASTGEIIGVGPKVRDPLIEVGCTAYHIHYDGLKVELNGDHVSIIPEADVISVGVVEQ